MTIVGSILIVLVAAPVAIVIGTALALILVGLFCKIFEHNDTHNN